MKLSEMQDWIEKATLRDLVAEVIFDKIMESTAHCGWTQNARLSLVNTVVESVDWAIDKKLPEKGEKE